MSSCSGEPVISFVPRDWLKKLSKPTHAEINHFVPCGSRIFGLLDGMSQHLGQHNQGRAKHGREMIRVRGQFLLCTLSEHLDQLLGGCVRKVEFVGHVMFLPFIISRALDAKTASAGKYERAKTHTAPTPS